MNTGKRSESGKSRGTADGKSTNKSDQSAARRKKLIQASNEAYAKLRRNPKAWKEELEERALWDATLADGLE